MIYIRLLVILICGRTLLCLHNNQLPSPPLGWTTHGYVYGCNVDCGHSPETCISETTLKGIADKMVTDGYYDVGYKIILIGECWSLKVKDPQGRLQPDTTRFPSGMKALVEYIHGKNLKVGIYIPLGSSSWNGYPGILNNERINIEMLQSWNVDMIEFDGYGIPIDQLEEKFTNADILLASSINSTIVSCIWPYYVLGGGRPDYKTISSKCNLFKSTKPSWLGNLWYDVLNVTAFYNYNVFGFRSTVGAGSWNDPGLVQTGDPRLYKSRQFSEYVVWSMLSAPVFVSTDIHNMDRDTVALLQNQKLIEIGQDTLDVQAKLMMKNEYFEVWHKFLSYGDQAVLIVNTKMGNTVRTLYASLSEMGVNMQPAYSVYDVLKKVSLGQYFVQNKFQTVLNSTESKLLRCYSEH